jgi:hypothetical protein
MKAVFFILLTCLMIGCADKGSSKIIPRPEMEKIMWELMQVDEFSKDYLVRDTTKDVKKEKTRLFQKVFQLHNVTEKQFSNSYKYYAARPEDIKVMFDSIAAVSQRQREYFYMPKDSIKK